MNHSPTEQTASSNCSLDRHKKVWREKTWVIACLPSLPTGESVFVHPVAAAAASLCYHQNSALSAFQREWKNSGTSRTLLVLTPDGNY